MFELEIANPVAEKQEKKITPAKRPASLNKKTVGLMWNGKPGGNFALDQIEEWLKEQYPEVRIKRYNPGYTGLKKNDLKKMSDECDAVVGSTGD